MKPAREVAHEVTRCRVSRWQCSGCRSIFFGKYKSVCPACGRDGYWSGSVDPDALAKLEIPHDENCDRLTAAIEARDAEHSASRPNLSNDELTQACLNVGIDLK